MSISSAIDAVKNVQPGGGEDHQQAVAAMTVLNAASISDIPQLLAAMDDATQPATNWLRSAVVTLAQREGDFPQQAISDYFSDRSHSGSGRFLAWELLAENNPDWAEQTLPTLVDDPSMPVRERAIGVWIDKAKNAEGAAAGEICQKYFDHARDLNQVVAMAEIMEDAGEAVDVQKQLGFIPDWKIVASFDNKDMAGFDVAHGPESAPGKIDADATYTSHEGEQSAWQSHATEDSLGVVDLNEIIGPVKGVSAYAVAEFEAAEDGTVELRIGTPNAHKIWLNGELVMSNEVYHNSNSADKFSATVSMKQGSNLILLKICQNEQEDSWAQDWQFQLRVCDETGKAVHE